MTKIFITLAGYQRGPFTEETIRQYLVEGILLPSDQAQVVGEETSTTVADALANIPPQPAEKFIRIKRKTASARARARRKKLTVISLYILLIFSIVLAYEFRQQIGDICYTLNCMLYAEWTSVAL